MYNEFEDLVEFEYVMPSGQTIDVIATANLIEDKEITDLTFHFYDTEGEPLEVIFDKDVFEDIEANALIHFQLVNDSLMGVDTFIANTHYMGKEYDNC